MNADEYQKEAMTTAGTTLAIDMLVVGALGLAGESGEVCDAVKKHFFHGHDLEKQKLALELGDVLWYLTLLAQSQGYTLSDIMHMNLKKLRERYPVGFSEQASINRKPEE